MLKVKSVRFNEHRGFCWRLYPYLPEKLQDFYDLHIRDLTNFWRCRMLWRRVKRFIAWTPILWQDEDWDAESLYRIMRFKISRIRNTIEENMRHGGDDIIIKEMKQAEFLLRRIEGSDYYYDLRDAWVRDFCSCPEETMTFENYPGGGGRMHFHHCPFCEKYLGKVIKKMDRKERADRLYLFNFIAKKSPAWWD